MTAIFITGSGTGVGKTFVAEVLIRQWREEGRDVAAIKPVVSGFDPGRVRESDTGRLIAALGLELSAQNINLMSPCRYAAALSPDMAAAREGKTVPYDEVVSYCRAVIEDCEATGGTLLIEGIGGVMVPLDGTRMVVDLIADLGIPAVLVSGSYLGALSHTLTAHAVLQARGISVEGIIVSETEGSEVPVYETKEVLERFAAPTPVHVFPFVEHRA